MHGHAMTAQAPALHRTLAVLAPPRRFQLLLLLLSGPVRSVSQLARAVRLSQSCTTRHLQALQRAGLVRREREGKKVHFRPSPRDATTRAVLASLETIAGMKPAKHLDPVLAAGMALGAIPVASAAEFEAASERSPDRPARSPRRTARASAAPSESATASLSGLRRPPTSLAAPDAAVPSPGADEAQEEPESDMNSGSAPAPVSRWTEIEDFLL